VPALALALSVALLLAWARLFVLGVRTRRALLDLGGAPPLGAPPALTVVVPCRDEARGVGAAVRSLLAQDLPDLQVIAVDDRSTDGTGELLDGLAAEDPRLEVIHLAALPPGWLGKNHACAAGARRARGAWILFTDGDVLFAPGALRRALGAAVAHRLGHLAVAPTFVAPGFAERAFVTAFAALLAPALRLWELPRAGTRAFFGVGAFNLVRRDAYEAVGGHARLPLEVVDDVKLGLLLRRSGVPQGAAASGGLVSVRWQHGLVPSVLGLVKNAFAAVEYRLPLALAGAAGGLLLGAGPVVLAIASPSAPARGAALAALAVSVLHHARWARAQAGARGAEGLLMPACATVLGAVVLGSALAARARGAVLWRGTRYPLDEVRTGCLRIADLSPAGAAAWPAPDEAPAAPPAHACDGNGPTDRRLR
jgi:cellulose synthase/poly-beta-1,6-N-acetylglucosamine synthase-like glycosyltransferase